MVSPIQQSLFCQPLNLFELYDCYVIPAYQLVTEFPHLCVMSHNLCCVFDTGPVFLVSVTKKVTFTDC